MAKSTWLDDPKLHAVMMHLGGVGADGKPTPAARMAKELNSQLVQVERCMQEEGGGAWRRSACQS